MLISRSTRRGTLVLGAVLVATVPTIVFTSLGGTSSAAGVPTSTDAGAGHPSLVVTPLASAVIPDPIDIDRTRPSNVVTARIDFPAHALDSWHFHPGSVFVQVVSGTVTLRQADHGRCLPRTVSAGQGFFESPGTVHSASNRHDEPAVAFATFVLPEGAPPEVAAPVPAACR